ncbi:hypothetical protein GGI43DRAFT_383972 [Trichoderma evansii]
MTEMSKIYRTRVLSETHRRVYILIIERIIFPYWRLRQIFKEHAVPSLQLYLQNKDDRLPAPPSPWGSSHDPFQPVDTAFFQAVTSPWNGLFITQFMDYATNRLFANLPHPLIFTAPATEYEAWKIDKEFKDLQDAGNTLQKSVQDMEYTGPRIKSAYGIERRALRLRSRGYGSGLGEVISVDEEWPEEGWASLIFLPGTSYDTRIEAKMKNRPFLLDSDPTDRSGIIPNSRVQKLLGGRRHQGENTEDENDITG